MKGSEWLSKGTLWVGVAVAALNAGCGEPGGGSRTDDVETIASALVVDDSNLSMATPNDVPAKRQQLVSFLWGTLGFPTRLAQRTGTVANPVTTPMTNLDHVDRLLATMAQGMENELFHFIPISSNGRLVIVHAGHAGGTSNGTSILDLNSTGVGAVIAALVADGYGVLGVPMPCYNSLGAAGCPVNFNLPWPHNQMFSTVVPPAGQGDTVKYFLADIAISLNYLRAKYATDHFPQYSEFDMVGISGGGWTTALYAAVDPTIKISIPCSGSKPMYLRPCSPVDGDLCIDEGQGNGYDADEEQMHLPLYKNTAGYLDIYALGAAGPGRRQVQVQLHWDGCCFGEPEYLMGANGQPRPPMPQVAGLSWTQAVRAYESKLQTFFTSSTDRGWYRFEIDETEGSSSSNAPHQIAPTTLVDTILSELDGDRRPVGAATSQDVYTKGLTGTLFHAPPSWTNTGFALVGAPSVVQSGSTTYVLLRDPASGLTELSSSNGGSWQSTPFPAVIAADPAATLSGTQLDVFAMGTDKRLWHWSRAGAGSIAGEQVDANTEVVGQVAAVTSGTGRLDVFARRVDGVFSHFTRNSGGRWAVDTMPSAFRGFPAAAAGSDGYLRAYGRGSDNELWENSEPLAGGSWFLARIPDYAPGASGVKMAGSPTTSINPSSQKVFVLTRGPSGNVEHFELVSGWVHTNEGVPQGSSGLTFTPVAVPGGFFARSVEGNVWFKSFSNGWTDDLGQIY